MGKHVWIYQEPFFKIPAPKLYVFSRLLLVHFTKCVIYKYSFNLSSFKRHFILRSDSVSGQNTLTRNSMPLMYIDSRKSIIILGCISGGMADRNSSKEIQKKNFWFTRFSKFRPCYKFWLTAQDIQVGYFKDYQNKPWMSERHCKEKDESFLFCSSSIYLSGESPFLTFQSGVAFIFFMNETGEGIATLHTSCWKTDHWKLIRLSSPRNIDTEKQIL